MEDFPDSQDRDPQPLSNLVREELEKLKKRSEEEAPLDTARRTLINLTNDADASPADIAAAQQQVMELEEQERHRD